MFILSISELPLMQISKLHASSSSVLSSHRCSSRASVGIFDLLRLVLCRDTNKRRSSCRRRPIYRSNQSRSSTCRTSATSASTCWSSDRLHTVDTIGASVSDRSCDHADRTQTDQNCKSNHRWHILVPSRRVVHKSQDWQWTQRQQQQQ